MNDETKAALESLRREMADGDPDWWKRERLIFNHIDSEPARLAAALEDLREACALRVDAVKCYGYGVEADEPGVRDQCAGEVRDTPLDATPLADELDEAHRGEREAWRQVDEVRTERDALRRWVFSVSEALGAIEPVSDCRVELGAEAAAQMAEALRARDVEDRLGGALLVAEVASLRALVADMETIDEALRQENTTLRARVAELEAQAAAARAVLVPVVERSSASLSAIAYVSAADVLRAMDEAAKR